MTGRAPGRTAAELEQEAAMKTAENEVRYWLEHNGKTLTAKKLKKAAEKALNLYLDRDYSSLENAVEDVMHGRMFFGKELREGQA